MSDRNDGIESKWEVWYRYPEKSGEKVTLTRMVQIVIGES